MNQDPSALRRRARRRLVGAVAIALTAVVVVPMLFDPDPKPLGSDVDIHIPAQESPFEPDTGAATPPAPAVVDPALAPAGAVSAPPGDSGASRAEPTPMAPPPKAPLAAGPLPKAEPPAAPKPEPKPASKPEPQPEPKPEPRQEARTKPEAKPIPKPEPAFASKGYYLQLGVFGSAANANGLKAKVEAAGFAVSVADSHGQYRVRIGPIPDRNKAQETLSRLKGKGFSAVMIGP